jgi:hypothetical protein
MNIENMGTLSSRERIAQGGFAIGLTGTSLLANLTWPAEISYTLTDLAFNVLELAVSANCMASFALRKRTYFGIPTIYRGLKSVAIKTNNVLKPIFGKIKRQVSENTYQNYPNTFYGLPEL